MEAIPLKLVLAEDVEALLDAIGLLSSVQLGETRCARCRRIISVEDVSKIEATNSGYELTCSAESCIAVPGYAEGKADAQR
jgi:hypothetical protein